MTETKVAKRYAKSLIDLTTDKGSLDAVNADMKLFISVCEQNKELSLLLTNPIIHSDKKINILKEIFGQKVNPVTIAFFELVTKKGREKYLEMIAKEFVSCYKQIKGIQTAEITSAAGLDEKLREDVYRLLRENMKLEIELVEKVDSKLIGGFVLRIGDKQYDASISSELRRLAHTFAENPGSSKN
jgi:F-type H+-transporting ATPase subunit delta